MLQEQEEDFRTWRNTVSRRLDQAEARIDVIVEEQAKQGVKLEELDEKQTLIKDAHSRLSSDMVELKTNISRWWFGFDTRAIGVTIVLLIILIIIIKS